MLDLAAAYETGSDEDQEFVLNIALFLTSFLGEHLKVLLYLYHLHLFILLFRSLFRDMFVYSQCPQACLLF
jgi:hypothetical protein